MAGLLKRKLEGEVEIKEGASDLFHEFFAKKPHHISSVKDDFIHACDLHDGAFGTAGSTIQWTYTVDGKKKTIKQIVEEIDEENKVIKFNCIGGDLMKDYKDFLVILKVIPLTAETSKVIWTFFYEKLKPGFPEPTGEMDALVKIAKDIEEHHNTVKK